MGSFDDHAEFSVVIGIEVFEDLLVFMRSAPSGSGTGLGLAITTALSSATRQELVEPVRAAWHERNGLPCLTALAACASRNYTKCFASGWARHLSCPIFNGAGRGLQGRGRGFDIGSIMTPDRTLQRQKEPSVTLVFCKSVTAEVAGSSPVVPAIHSKRVESVWRFPS